MLSGKRITCTSNTRETMDRVMETVGQIIDLSIAHKLTAAPDEAGANYVALLGDWLYEQFEGFSREDGEHFVNADGVNHAPGLVAARLLWLTWDNLMDIGKDYGLDEGDEALIMGAFQLGMLYERARQEGDPRVRPLSDRAETILKGLDTPGGRYD